MASTNEKKYDIVKDNDIPKLKDMYNIDFKNYEVEFLESIGGLLVKTALIHILKKSKI